MSDATNAQPADRDETECNTCHICHHFLQYDPETLDYKDKGLCRRYPPTVVNEFQTLFPEVLVTDTCGEWRISWEEQERIDSEAEWLFQKYSIVDGEDIAEAAAAAEAAGEKELEDILNGMLKAAELADKEAKAEGEDDDEQKL